jgi:hypothetical protein
MLGKAVAWHASTHAKKNNKPAKQPKLRRERGGREEGERRESEERRG